MADIAALKAALDQAEADKEALIQERAEKRRTMSKYDFRAYNEETHQQQIDVQKAVDDAQAALTSALNDVRSEALNVAVGTISESNSAGGTS